MPGLLWLVGIILLIILSFVVISVVIMPSLTIISTNRTSCVKRGDDCERKCKSLSYLSFGDSSPEDELDKAQARPPEEDVWSQPAGSSGNRAVVNAKEIDPAESMSQRKTVDICIDNVETSHTDSGANDNHAKDNGDIQKDRKGANGNVCIANFELRIARLETLPLSNDFNGIKVAKVIRTQNLRGGNTQEINNLRSECSKQENSKDSTHPERSTESLQEEVKENASLSNEKHDSNLVPNFIIGDELYNYDLSSNVLLVSTGCTDNTVTTHNIESCIEEIPCMDLNEMKRKKRRKRNKCMEIFNVPVEILNRIEEEPLGAHGPSHDLAAQKILEHVPDSELVENSDQPQSGSVDNFRPHSTGPNSSDLSFSWVFNHQLTSVQTTSQSFPTVNISEELNKGTPSQTFDSFNKPLKKHNTNSLNNCDQNDSNNLPVKEHSKENDISIGNNIKNGFTKKNKMVDIKSKLKEVKIQNPIFCNEKVIKTESHANNVAINVQPSDGQADIGFDQIIYCGLAPTPESCFNSTHTLLSDSSMIDRCCSSDTHEQCSLISNLEVQRPESKIEAPAHFIKRNEQEMPSPTFTYNEAFDFQLGPSEHLPNAQFSPAYFLRNNHMTNIEHSQKSISDLDFLIGSFQGQLILNESDSSDPQSNSLSYLLQANDDLTTSDVDVKFVPNLEENALRSLDELCTKSLESLKSDPGSLSSTKSKKVTFLEGDTPKINELAYSGNTNSIITDLDDECDKESDTLVEEDALSLSSSTSSLTSSSSESSGQSMIFNGVPVSPGEEETEIPKMDAAVLKHTSIAHALNQHNFHTYLSPIRELSLEISADESDHFSEDVQSNAEISLHSRRSKGCSKDSRSAIDQEQNECVTSFSTDDTEDFPPSTEQKVRLVVARVEEVELMKSQFVHIDVVSSEGNSAGDTSSGTVSKTDGTSYSIDRSCVTTAIHFANNEENPETPIQPVVLNTKFNIAQLTNKDNLTETDSSVVEATNTSGSDELERCSGRAKTNSSGSDLSSELEHILSSIDYESSRSEQSLRKYSPSNCSNLSGGSKKSDYQEKVRSPSFEQLCRKYSSGSDCSSQSSSSVDSDIQDGLESKCLEQNKIFRSKIFKSNGLGSRTLNEKATRSSYLPLKKYELVNVPQKVTKETLCDEKESSCKYRQMVIEKIKNFENITSHKDENSENPKKMRVSKLREPVIKIAIEQEFNSILSKDSYLLSKSSISTAPENPRLECKTLKKIVQVPNVLDKVKSFEQKILERENSKSPSPEPVDFKNVFSEKLSSFENLAKRKNNGSPLKNTSNIDVKVKISEKLQNFENRNSSRRETSKSPDFTEGKPEETSKSAENLTPETTKTQMKSIRSTYEEKLRSCQPLFNDSNSDSPKPTKKKFDVMNRISSFESQIKMDSETPKKIESPVPLSRIPKMKTKSLDSIFISQQVKLESSNHSNNVQNISAKNSSALKINSKLDSIVHVPNSNQSDSNLRKPIKHSPQAPSVQFVGIRCCSNKKGFIGQLTSPKFTAKELEPKVDNVKFSNTHESMTPHHQTEIMTGSNVDEIDSNPASDKRLDVIAGDQKCPKDALNDSGITADFEDGLKINISHNDDIGHSDLICQDRDVMDMLASIEAVEKLDAPPNSIDEAYRRTGLVLADDIFFRSHVLPQLEAERDKKLSSRVVAFQAQCRGYLARKHLAKLKVQDVAVRCIQRNVKKFMDVRDWSWWRLYLKIHPILNVHRTDQELQAKTEELEALKSKLEKLEVERNILKQDNARLESKLGEITEDYADEHSTASLATERLNIECSERSRLEKELAEAQTTNKKLQDTSDKLEAEVQCLRATDALSLDELSEEDGGVFKKKYERAMRELELTKHRLTTQHQDDLEQLVALRKQLESKLSDAYEQIEEQRSVTSEWKRKVARINSEMSDLRLALEEQSSRNNLLEKKQRKFDAEFSMLQDELRQERNLKEKAMRDKELALGDKYTVEQTMSSLKLELELKEQKLSSLQQELEELTFSGNTEEEVANLKKKKHALEAKITDQEEELDELAGQVQMLEQAKLKVEMSLEQLRKAHRKELASKDEELESLRCSTQKKVKALQCQLDSEHESRTQLLRERHELERRLNTLEDMGVASQAADAETNQRLKRDLKRTKALLKDTQSMLAQARQDNPNKLLLRQLRNQLEDAELGRSAATKAKLGLEGDLADLATSLDETQRARQEAETRLSEVQRERGSLQSMLDETEEEMTEVLKKYQASVAQLSTEQSNLQEATTRISELESENAAYKSQLSDLNARLETIETHGDPSSTLALKRLQLKSKELESKLEFEHTTRSRLEVQISRLKETTDKLQSECNILRSKESSSSNDSRKLQRQIRELKETIQALEAKGINESMKRKELEKEVQCREAEISSLKNELSVASQRIQDLQHAIQGDLDDDDDSDSDASSDQDQDPSSDEEYNSQLDDDGYDSKDTLRSSSDVGR